MDSQYVVELKCVAAQEARLSQVSVYAEMLANVAGWWNWMTGENRFSVEMFLSAEPDRRQELEVDINGLRSQMVYRSLSSSTHQCALFKVVKPLQRDSPVTMQVFITLLQDRDKDYAFCRIEMGRDTDGLIIPSDLSTLRRPGIITNLIRNPKLRYYTAVTGNLVDGKPTHIGSPELLVPIVEALPKDRRLPLLLVSRSHNDRNSWFPNQVANELTGLAQVLTIPHGLTHQMDEEIRKLCPHIRLMPGGATLIWPDPNSVAIHPRFHPPNDKDTTTELMRILGPLSVTASGTDWMRETGRSAFERDRRRMREEKLRAQRDSRTEGITRERLAEMEEEWMSYVQEAEDARDLAEQRAQQLEQEINSLKSRLYYLYSASESDKQRADLASGAPDMAVHGVEKLAAYLEEQTDGAIVFTDNAFRSWHRTTYSDVETMQSALCSLAQAAQDYANLDARLPMMPDDWFMTGYQLRMSSTDGGLKKRNRDRFTFEGVEYSRLPHLKLNDYDNFKQIGRVYFAMDSANKRFIVDHLGNKLYDPYTARR